LLPSGSVRTVSGTRYPRVKQKDAPGTPHVFSDRPCCSFLGRRRASRLMTKEAAMRIRTFSAAVGAGAALALAAAIPAAQAKEVDASHQSAGALSAQTLRVLEAQWRAEVAAHKTTM